jgi:hypothetical protein
MNKCKLKPGQDVATHANNALSLIRTIYMGENRRTGAEFIMKIP